MSWNGKRGDSFDTFRAIFEGNLPQQGIGYACHDSFLECYQQYGDDGNEMFLSDDSIPNDVKLSVPDSREQIQYDKQYIFGALKIACRESGTQVPILEHCNDYDGFLTWFKIRQ